MILSTLLLSTSGLSEHSDDFEFSKELDHEFLSKNYSDNLELAVSIFNHFTENIDAELETFQQNIDHSNFEGIRSIAHKIKNNFTYVGATNLSTLTKQIEIEAKEEKASVAETYNQFKLASINTLNSISNQLESIKEYLDKK